MTSIVHMRPQTIREMSVPPESGRLLIVLPGTCSTMRGTVFGNMAALLMVWESVYMKQGLCTDVLTERCIFLSDHGRVID
jgi:hypothetical protein